MSTPWRTPNAIKGQPCKRDCPDRTWDCKISCPKWAEYEAKKQEIYEKRLEILRGCDYTSQMAMQIVRRKVIDSKQGRGYR